MRTCKACWIRKQKMRPFEENSCSGSETQKKHRNHLNIKFIFDQKHKKFRIPFGHYFLVGLIRKTQGVDTIWTWSFSWGQKPKKNREHLEIIFWGFRSTAKLAPFENNDLLIRNINKRNHVIIHSFRDQKETILRAFGQYLCSGSETT